MRQRAGAHRVVTAQVHIVVGDAGNDETLQARKAWLPCDAARTASAPAGGVDGQHPDLHLIRRRGVWPVRSAGSSTGDSTTASSCAPDSRLRPTRPRVRDAVEPAVPAVLVVTGPVLHVSGSK